jgi:hypothetical protein
MNAADLRCELRLGRWQDALGDVGEVDALITDPPYSERTHGAYREMAKLGRKAIEYAHLTEQDARALVSAWAPRTRGWMVIFTDHFLAPVFAAAMEAQDRYAFAPLACVEPGARVRLCGSSAGGVCCTGQYGLARGQARGWTERRHGWQAAVAHARASA